MKRLFVILFAVVLSSATFGEIRYCEKGTKNEHSHFSSHDVPLAKGVRVKQKGPVGYSCKTNDHPLVVWSRSFNGWRVDFSIDVRPIDRKKSDLYVKWIKAEQIKGESAQMSVGGDWKEEAHCVMALGNVMVVAADLTSEKKRVWRHLSAIPAEGGMVVLVDFCVQAGSVAAAKKHATEGCNEIARALSNFELLNPLVKKVNKSTATAWFVTPTHLVTCAHCAKEGEKFWFMDAKERRVDLKLVGRDARNGGTLAVGNAFHVNTSGTYGWETILFDNGTFKALNSFATAANGSRKTFTVGEGDMTIDTQAFTLTWQLRIDAGAGKVVKKGAGMLSVKF